jgi:hypothetical protein
MNASRIRIAGLLAGLAALVVSLIPTAASADVAPAQVPAGLQTAIKAEVEARGHEYAGLARVVNENPPLPFGKWVAFVLSIEHDIAEVTIGPVASDEIHRVNFENRNGTWVKQGAVATPTQGSGGTATPKPPATGDGLADDSGSDSTVLFGVVGAAIAAMAGAGLVATIARRR